jgi:hypothetical protein
MLEQQVLLIIIIITIINKGLVTELIPEPYQVENILYPKACLLDLVLFSRNTSN